MRAISIATEHQIAFLGFEAFDVPESGAIAAVDIFTVPTITFGVLYGFFVISHDRWRILHHGSPLGRRKLTIVPMVWREACEKASCYLSI